MPPSRPALERFLEKIEFTDDCWLWTGATHGGGYGNFWTGERLIPAHRFAYEVAVGLIPEGLDLDHLCRVRLCVNPDHLEPVTRRENLLRGEGRTAQRASQTHCHRGHEFSEVNTYRNPRTGARECRTCHRENERARKLRLRQPAA